MKRVGGASGTTPPGAKRSHWSHGLLISMSDPDLIVKSDDKMVMIRDKYIPQSQTPLHPHPQVPQGPSELQVRNLVYILDSMMGHAVTIMVFVNNVGHDQGQIYTPKPDRNVVFYEPRNYFGN